MEICQEYEISALMVTHDVDEAVLLSDRLVMLTNGPESKIGGILEVDIPRPRKRMEVVTHRSYYALRGCFRVTLCCLGGRCLKMFI
jgi:bicarbonate transport system ATP-binding protein